MIIWSFLKTPIDFKNMKMNFFQPPRRINLSFVFVLAYYVTVGYPLLVKRYVLCFMIELFKMSIDKIRWSIYYALYD